MKARRASLRSLLPWACALLTSLATVPTEAAIEFRERKMALVIGNSHYSASGQEDVSGVENAVGLMAALEELGFTVRPVFDGKIHGTENLIGTEVDSFRDEIHEASVVVVFYSGHGFQLEGRNYLLPVDGSLSKGNSIAVDDIVQKLAAAPRAVKLVFLDTCRTNLRLSEGARGGFARPEGAPPQVLQAFAASFDQTAVAGDAGARSPYTMALLNHIREPGLELLTLLSRVRAEVLRETGSQYPTEDGLSAIPKGFFLRKPVYVQARIEQADDDLVVLLNGEVVLDRSAQGQDYRYLRLNAGSNRLTLLVSNSRTFHSNQTWLAPEGWSYALRLFSPNGLELTAPDCEGRSPCFSGGETVPFKDGPHHGHVFQVAGADLFVDPVSAQLELRDVETDRWSRDSPLWAKDQKPLFEIAVNQIPLAEGSQLRTYMTIIESVKQILAAFGLLNAIEWPDFSRIFAMVWGNTRFLEAVDTCMGARQADRIADLERSVADFLAGSGKRPFDSFDKSLSLCVQTEARLSDPTLADQEIRVWTAFDDRISEATVESTLSPTATEVRLGPFPIRQLVRGVPIASNASVSLSLRHEQEELTIAGRVTVDLSDLRSKIGKLVDTIPFPTDRCAHQGLNPEVRIWGKELTFAAGGAAVVLHGDIKVWSCPQLPFVEGPVLTQPFDATIPFHLLRDAQTIGIEIDRPSTTLGGPWGGVTGGILNLAGVDVNDALRRALQDAIGPQLFRAALPAGLQELDFAFIRAELQILEGVPAAVFELTAKVDSRLLRPSALARTSSSPTFRRHD